MAAPAEKLEIQTPTASVRWRGSANMLRISDRVEGARAAPATPSRARAAISVPAVGAKAANTEAVPNPAAPPSRTRRRPIRSPRVPMVTREPAAMNP
jgi:hypothetical protein